MSVPVESRDVERQRHVESGTDFSVK